jgi:hypothetical protein
LCALFFPYDLFVGGLVERATPVLLSQYDEESLQSLQSFVDQIPKVLDQVFNAILAISHINVFCECFRIVFRKWVENIKRDIFF